MSMLDELRQYEANKAKCDGQHVGCDVCREKRQARLQVLAASGRPLAGLAAAALRLNKA